jgi:hypothetical protein
MNLSASQHAMTPPGRKRLFVKVQTHYPGTPGNKMEDHSLLIQMGAYDDRSRNPACILQGIRTASCDPPRTLKYYQFASGLNSSITQFFYTLRAFAGNPGKLLPMLTFGFLSG